MKLIIAEKPSVAKAIAPVVGASEKKKGYTQGNGYIVSWCFGHLAQLKFPDKYCEKWAEKPWNFSQLPMIPDKWLFDIKSDCKEQFNILKKLMNDSDTKEIICATDADREGECIFRYVYNLTGCKKPVSRLWVSSLEETAIKAGLAKMKNDSEYNNLFSAGFSRAKADWLVGMNGSRLFSCRYKQYLTLGRVQTPTLAMIVKRDFDEKNFVKQKYFTVEIDCGTFTASTDRIDNETTADKICSLCDGKNAVVQSVKKESKSTNPPKLYDLTTLQREANKRFGYTAQQTLDYQQLLYEKKLSTYPRTDSQYLSDDMKQTILTVAEIIGNTFDYGIVENPDTARVINNKKVSGHHAIIPTANIADYDLSSLSEGELNILKLEANRLLCAISEPQKYETVSVILNCENNSFSAKGKTILSEGWTKYAEKLSEKSDKKEDTPAEKKLPDLTENQVFESISSKKAEHWTSPPKPYTEDTLLTAMEHAGQEDYDEETEKKGLGTPATRASIIESLVNREYIQRKGKQISATEKGINLIKVVPEEVKSPKLTAEWEQKLQLIEKGKYQSGDFMNEITEYVKEICSKYGSEDNSVSFKSSAEPLGKCPKCGGEITKGKFGFHCKNKCGMNVAKVYGKELTESQLKNLLSGKEISYTSKGKKTIVIPQVEKNEYKGKTYFQWKTKKG